LIDDHFNRHPASPYAAAAFLVKGPRGKSPMTALAVDLQRWRNTAPRRWRCLVYSLGRTDFQLADLVEFSRLQPRIRNRQRITGDSSPCLKLVFSMRTLPYSDEKSRASLPTMPPTFRA
jgi:hypothetical protein